MNVLLGNLVLMVALAPLTAGPEERVVVLPRDTTPFTVAQDEVVRLTGKGIAGSQIVAKIDGPAKIIAQNAIREVAKGHLIVGPGNVEFEIKPLGKGTVKVTITSTPPTGEKTLTKYEFHVQ